MAAPPPITRRHFLSTSAAILTSASVGLSAASTQVAAAKPFEMRNAMRFVDMPDTTHNGLPKVTVIYAARLWPKNASKAEPDVQFLKDRLLPKLKQAAPWDPLESTCRHASLSIL